MKGRFKLIIILMAISLFGIILIQTLWIRKTIQAEGERFDKAVYNSLANTVSGLERRQIYHFIDRKIDLPMPPKIIPGKFPPPRIDRVAPIFPVHDSLSFIDKQGRQVVVFSDTSNKSKTIIKFRGQVNDTAFETIDLEVLADSEIFAPEVERLLTISNSMDSLQIQAKIEQEELQWEQQMLVREKMDEFNKSMEQWVYEYSFDDENLIGEFLVQNLDSIISRALANNGIRLGFHTQIVREEKDTTEIVWPKSNHSRILPNQYKTELFPNDYFRKNFFPIICWNSVYKIISLN